ncbi:unnamed protein product [Ceratitis capitata]|uniref:(Mediterranean fruit fly) hypothetical protein n=1 Tax=Ceratitis capitata TaxID=7213 RepID=A0A811V1H8_CERCA|nr:unnamed protein product [Ceratitis capitata]
MHTCIYISDKIHKVAEGPKCMRKDINPEKKSIKFADSHKNEQRQEEEEASNLCPRVGVRVGAVGAAAAAAATTTDIKSNKTSKSNNTCGETDVRGPPITN